MRPSSKILSLLLAAFPSLAPAVTFTGSSINTAGNNLIPSSGTGGCGVAPQTTGGTIFQVNVSGLPPTLLLHSLRINLTHTWDADLDIFLRAPNGDVIELSTDNGSSGDDYTNTVFQDGFPSITTGTPPFTGTFSPEGTIYTYTCGASLTTNRATLGAFPPGLNGTWELVIFDDAGGDTGQMLDWDITFTGPPTFSYSPAAPGPVTGTHTSGTIGSTANLSIGVAIGTAGAGTGPANTTTLTCSPPPPPFSGFTATPTAVGSGPVSPTSITGTCTVAATTQTGTLNCTEDRGGTPVPVNFTLECPAATIVPPTLSLSPPPGSTITGSGGGFVGSTANFSIAGTITNPGTGTGAGATTTFSCTPPGSPFAGFTGTMQAVGNDPLTGSPITGTCTVGPAPVTVTMTCQLNEGGNISEVTYQLVCPLGLPQPRPVDTLDRLGLALLALVLLALGAVAYRRLS